MKTWNPIFRIAVLVTGVCGGSALLGAAMGLGVYYLNQLAGGSL
jgi:hypothetical protein